MPAIRPAVAGEEAAVVALWDACGLVVAGNDPVADFRLARGREGSDVLVAEGGTGQIVGTVMVGHDGHRGWLYYVAADPAHRGQGIGRALVEAGEAWLAARGLPKIQLMVRETNPAVTAFYARLGYAAIPRTVMQKRLEAGPAAPEHGAKKGRLR